MSYITDLVPKSLLIRFLLIITIPTILGQLIAVYIFYDRHWYNVSYHTSGLIAREVDLIAKEWGQGNISAVNTLSKELDIDYKFHKHQNLKKKKYKNWAELEILQSRLTSHVKYESQVRLSEGGDKIIVDLQFKDGIMTLHFSAKLLMNPTTYIFVLWIIFLTFILLAVSLIFSKNQIKSILELASAADEFGRGISDRHAYKPSGALEIRKAGLAFIRMRDRIERQIERRTQMLAMISHDLRTPLTRMKLQLALMDAGEGVEGISEDVQSMEQMIASYLDFARGEWGEDFKIINLYQWFNDNLKSMTMNSLKINFDPQGQALLCRIKPHAFKRAILNILSNSSKYADKARVTLYKLREHIIIDIEDNGSGISNEEKGLVFKPFYRSDKSRGLSNQPSVGLGLAITREIVAKHDGVILLKDGKSLGGLLVRIMLPAVDST